MQRVGVLFTVMLSGCSFVLVSGPPSNHQQLPSFECTTSRLGPGLDTVWTVLQTLNFVTTLSRTSQEWDDVYGGNPPFSRSTALPLYAGLAALGAAGMYFGFSRTSECRSAKSALNARVMQPGMQPGMGGQPAPGTWPPPGQPAPQGAWPPPGQPAPQGGAQPYPTQPQPNQAQPSPYPAPPPAPTTP
jgi:hypothetical protein